MPATKYTFPVTSEVVFLGDLQTQIEPQLPTITHIGFTGESYEIWFSDALTVEQQDTLAQLVAAHDPLLIAKLRMCGDIDERTELNIHRGPGFEWPPGSGNYFSTSANAQIKWLGMAVGKDFFDYVNDPPKVRTKDDLVEYTIADANEVGLMYGTAMGVVRAYLNVNRETKSQVLAAPDLASAQAIYQAFINS